MYNSSDLNYYTSLDNTERNDVLPGNSIYSFKLTGINEDGPIIIEFNTKIDPITPTNICIAEKDATYNNYFVKKNN
jgi:hypothetical protein